MIFCLSLFFISMRLFVISGDKEKNPGLGHSKPRTFVTGT